MRKQPATYRIPPDLLAAATVKAAERGETVTDVVIRGLQVYVQGSEAAGITLAAPAAVPTVHTPVEAPASYEEPPEAPACKHPADRVEAGECRVCGADVW